MKKKLPCYKKGSLTVEASLTFTVFLCFFLLLVYIVQAACINIYINHAVNEAAKQLASTCYPITFLNDLEDDIMESGGSSIYTSYSAELENSKDIILSSAQQLLKDLLSGDVGQESINDMVYSFAQNAIEYAGNGIKGYIVKNFAGEYYSVKTKVKYAAANYLVEKFCEDSPVERDNLKLLLVELPQGDAEFSFKSSDESYGAIYEKLGFAPGKDDVVIAVEYKMKIPLPFLSRDIVTRHVAVEKAWLHGGNGVYTVDESYGGESDDKGDSDDDEAEEDRQKERNETVYVTRTGKKYHKGDCPRSYLSESKIPISLLDAKGRGYTPCKVCVTKTAKPLKNY